MARAKVAPPLPPPPGFIMFLCTLLALAAPQGAALQQAQAMFPQPPGTDGLSMGRAVAVDGDRALVALGDVSTDAAVEFWMYDRTGLAWTPAYRFPTGAVLSNPVLELEGDRAFLGSEDGLFEEYRYSSGSWSLAHSLDGFGVRAIDLEAGTAIGQIVGSFPEYHAIAERGPAGWSVVWADTTGTTVSFSMSDYDIDGEIAVIGAGPWFACNHFYWDGAVDVIERSEPVGSTTPGTWSHTTELRETDCMTESRLGEWVAVENGQIFATREHWWGNTAAQVRIFHRTSAGTWDTLQTITSESTNPDVGFGLAVKDGVLVTGNTTSHSATTAGEFVHMFEQGDFGLWSYARRLDASTWSIVNGWPNFSHRMGLYLYRVDAPPATGIGARMGVLVSDIVGSQGDQAIGAFDPIVSADVCDGVANSTGTAAELSIPGSDVLGDNRMEFHVANLPANTLALPIVSMAFGFIANPGGSAGNLCVGTSATRLVALAGAASAFGTFQVGLDLTALPQSPLQSGDRLFFQTWYRDVPTTNFSNAVAVQVF